MTKPAYKLAHIDKTEIALATRKGLMVADSHYYAWPEKQQERFRATMSEKARNKVQRVLIKCLLGIKCSPQELSDTWDDIPLSKLNMINWANLLTQGIGEDYIFLNEYMAEGKCLLDFSTLYDYDYNDHLFQEEAMGIISWIIMGLIVGVIAKFIMPGKDPGGFIITILLGIAGAFFGGYIGSILGFGAVTGFNLGSLLLSIGGAVLILILYRAVKR